MTIKPHDIDKMVEIPINQLTNYENRVDVGLMLNTQTMDRKKLYDTKTKLVLSLEMIVEAENPDDAKLVAKEAAHELPRLLTEDLTEEEKMFALAIYVAGWDEDCIDVKEMDGV